MGDYSPNSESTASFFFQRPRFRLKIPGKPGETTQIDTKPSALDKLKYTLLTNFGESSTSVTQIKVEKQEIGVCSFGQIPNKVHAHVQTTELFPCNSITKEDKETSPIPQLNKEREQLRLAASLLKASKTQIEFLRGERDGLAAKVEELVKKFKTFRSSLDGELAQTRQTILELERDHLRFLAEIRQQFEYERSLVLSLVKNFEKKRKQSDQRMLAKEERLKEVEKQWQQEMEYGDKLKKLTLNVKEKNDKLEKLMRDTLYVKSRAFCDNCVASRRVSDALENQVVLKGQDNRKLQDQLEELEKKLKEKERISLVLGKETERLNFELTQVKREFDRQLKMARKDWETELDRALKEVAAESKTVKVPSPPGSEESDWDTANQSGELAATPDSSSGQTPVTPSQNPFSGWERTPKSKPVTQPSPVGPLGRKRPSGPIPEAQDDLKKKVKATFGDLQQEMVTMLETRDKQNLPPPETSAQGTSSASDSPQAPPVKDEYTSWLEWQLESYENLVAWYRAQIKSLTDDANYFQGRLVEDTEKVEEQLELLVKKQTELDECRNNVDLLRATLSNLANSVTTYFHQ